jgi:lysophospholipase L1-like esterase/photosystem II stability/assembly factor-like uncharacterized protein
MCAVLLAAMIVYGSLPAFGQGKSNARPASGKKLASPAKSERPLYWQPLGEPGSGGWMTGLIISPHNSRRKLISGDMLGIGLSEDGGKTWQSTFGLKSYECADFTWHPTDPNVVWVGTMSGPYVSRDGGHNWQERRKGLPPYGDYYYSAPIEKVLLDPADPRRLLAFSGSSRRWQSPGQPAWGAVWESRDAGASWTRSADLGKNIVSAAWGSGSRRVFAALDAGGVWRSEDGGKTWEKSSAGLPHDNVERVIAHPKNSSVAWVSLENYKPPQGDCLPGGVYKTTDGGKTWLSISEGLSQKRHSDPNFTARYKAFAVSMSNPNVMYAADSAWDTGVLYGTKDGGKRWYPQATRGNVGNDNHDPNRQRLFQVKTAYFAGIGGTVMAIDPNNPNVAYCLGSEHILATYDGGRTWVDAGNDPAGNGAWRGRGFSGLCCTNFVFNPKRPDDALLVGMDAGKLWRGRDGLKTWTYHGHEPWPWGGGVDAVYAGDHIYSTAGQFGSFLGILRSKDDGRTWQALGGAARGLPELQSQNAQPSAIYARPDAPQQVWTIISGKLHRSLDAGEKWEIVQSSLNLIWIAADPNNTRRLFLSGERGVFLTDDGGATVQHIGGPKPATRISTDQRGRLYATSWRGARGGVWRWDGQNWARLWDNAFVHHIASDPFDPTRIAVATHDNPYHDVTFATGVWISADDGKTWRQANDGLPILRGESIAFDPHRAGRMVFGSNGRGFFVTRWNVGFLPNTKPVSYSQTEEDVRYATAETRSGRAVIRLKNGDMEMGNDIPAAWETQWVGSGKIAVLRDTQTFKEGKASLCVASFEGAATGQSSQIVDGGAGNRFVLSGWVRSRGAIRVNVGVQPFHDNWTPITFFQVHYIQNDTDWTEFRKEVTLPLGTARFGVLLLIEGEGKAWLDSVKISGENTQNVAIEQDVVPPPATQDPCLPFPGFFPDYPKAWMAFHNQYVEQAKQREAEIVFLGDSITQGWGGEGKMQWEERLAPRKAVNFGIGGDKTSQILWRIEHGTLDGLKPKVVVLAIGVNNLWRNEHGNARIAEGIGRCVQAIRKKCPQAKVLIIGIFPTQKEPTNPLRATIRDINTLTARYADGNQVRFLDSGAKFLEPDGSLSQTIMPDYLHLSKEGYRRYADVLLPVLEAMLR